MRFSSSSIARLTAATLLLVGLNLLKCGAVEIDRSWQIEQKSGEWMQIGADARNLEKKGDYAAAVIKFTAVLEQRQKLGLDLLSEHLALADLYEKMKQFEKADALHKQAIEMRERDGGDDDPTAIFPLQSYADFLRRTKKPAEAAVQMKRIAYIERQRTASPKALVALTATKNLSPTQRSMKAVEIGDLYLKRDQERRALMAYNKAVAWDPKNAAAYAARGETYRRLEQDFNSERDLDKAIALESGNVRARFVRAMFYETQGKFKLAEADFTKAIDMNPNDTEALGYRAKMYQNTKRPALAMADYTRVLALKPGTRWSLVQRGLCCMDMKDFAKAVTNFQELIQVAPGNKDYYTMLADAYKGLEGPESVHAKEYLKLAGVAKR